MNEDYSFEEELEKELYGEKKSERLGKVKKIWGIRIKQSPQSEEWQPVFSNSDLFSFFRFNLKKIFLISILFFIISAGIFGFVFYYRSIYLKGVEIEIIGPIEVNAFQPYEYTINLNNSSNYDIKDVKLFIKLDEGIYFFDNPEETELSYNLGDFKTKNNKEVKIKLFFVSSLGKNLSLNAELHYLSPKGNQSFSLSKNLLITVKKEPISFQIFAPNQIFVNEPFLLSLKFTNTSEATYDLSLFLEANPQLELMVVQPSYIERFKWEFNQFQPNQAEEINITAKFVQFLNKPIISFKPVVIYRNKEFILKDYYLTLNVIENPIKLLIVSNQNDYLIELNKYITYEIIWENKSKISLENVQLKIYLSGGFDFESINTDGYFSPIENSIIWNSRNKPQLISIQSGIKDSVRFTIKTLRDYPSGKKNIDLVVRAVMETESIPPEVQIISKKLTVETQQTKIIPGNIEVKINVLYDKKFNNTGPFPLVSGKQTNLTAYFDICTFAEDFQNIIIKGKIPLGVNLTGNFDLNFDTNNFQFYPETGEFNYRIDELNAGYCDIYPPYQLAFQISVTPPLYGNLRDFIVLPSFKISAQGKYSQKIFNFETKPVFILNIRKSD